MPDRVQTPNTPNMPFVPLRFTNSISGRERWRNLTTGFQEKCAHEESPRPCGEREINEHE